MQKNSSFISLRTRRVRSLLFVAFAALCLLVPRLARAGDKETIYDDALQNGWGNRSWAKVNLNATGTTHGGSNSISVDADGYAALFLSHDAMDTSGFKTLTFWIHGGPDGGQEVQLVPIVDEKSGKAYSLGKLPANAWKQVTVSLSDLGMANTKGAIGFQFGNATGEKLSTFYVDDISLGQ